MYVYLGTNTTSLCLMYGVEILMSGRLVKAFRHFLYIYVCVPRDKQYKPMSYVWGRDINEWETCEGFQTFCIHTPLEDQFPLMVVK